MASGWQRAEQSKILAGVFKWKIPEIPQTSNPRGENFADFSMIYRN